MRGAPQQPRSQSTTALDTSASLLSDQRVRSPHSQPELAGRHFDRLGSAEQRQGLHQRSGEGLRSVACCRGNFSAGMPGAACLGIRASIQLERVHVRPGQHWMLCSACKLHGRLHQRRAVCPLSSRCRRGSCRLLHPKTFGQNDPPKDVMLQQRIHL